MNIIVEVVSSMFIPVPATRSLFKNFVPTAFTCRRAFGCNEVGDSFNRKKLNPAPKPNSV
jgi:hypothetical protein